MRIRRPPRRISRPLRVILSILLIATLVGGYYAYQWFNRSGVRMTRLRSWLQDAESHPDWVITAGERCGDSPFSMPTSGYIGFLWDDSFRPGHRHQGLDIFGGSEIGITPVYAAYSGYLTRLSDWRSTVIIRIPSDPLQPNRQIWTYYTHMASKSGEPFINSDFPPGASEIYVEEGTLLGYQGNYSGDPNNPTGIHLHFSIVKDDGSGHFLNELKIQNTLDPSPYLGICLNAKINQGQIPVCDE